MEERLELQVEDRRPRYQYSRLAPPSRWPSPCPQLEVEVEPQEQVLGQGSSTTLRETVPALT